MLKHKGLSNYSSQSINIQGSDQMLHSLIKTHKIEQVAGHSGTQL